MTKILVKGYKILKTTQPNYNHYVSVVKHGGDISSDNLTVYRHMTVRVKTLKNLQAKPDRWAVEER